MVGNDDRLSLAFDVIEPYLPVLKRMGKAGVDAFLDAVRQQDWARVDRALYEQMTESERDALGDDVLKAARTAVKDAYETNRLWQEDLLRLSLSLLLSAI
jgi:hypothetical protein